MDPRIFFNQSFKQVHDKIFFEHIPIISAPPIQNPMEQALYIPAAHDVCWQRLCIKNKEPGMAANHLGFGLLMRSTRHDSAYFSGFRRVNATVLAVVPYASWTVTLNTYSPLVGKRNTSGYSAHRWICWLGKSKSSDHTTTARAACNPVCYVS